MNSAAPGASSSVADVLQLAEGGGWRALPTWARFFLELGEHLGNVQDRGSRLVVAVVVPTRSLAVAFSAVGAIVGRVKSDLSPLSQAEHFAHLRSLPMGTPLLVTRGGRQLPSHMVAPALVAGETWIRVRILTGKSEGEIYYLSQRDAMRVTVQSAEMIREQDGRRSAPVVSGGPLIEVIFGQEGLRELCGQAYLECLMIGKAGLLRKELGHQIRAIRPDGAFALGRLGDLARTRQTIGTSGTYRSYISNATNPSWPRGVPSRLPTLALFDGGLPFLKWRHHFLACHWLVVLDRTDPRSLDAANQLRGEYTSGRTDFADDIAPLSVPSKVELAAFWENRQ